MNSTSPRTRLSASATAVLAAALAAIVAWQAIATSTDRASPDRPAAAANVPRSTQPVARQQAPSTKPATTRPSATPPDRVGVPSHAEIGAAFERGAYPEVIKLVDRALRASDKLTPLDDDRHAIALFKGEAYLRLGQYKSAADAFTAAAKLAHDEVRAARARATARVVAETKGPRVQRRRGGSPQEEAAAAAAPAASADLLDPAQRDAALSIFRDDLRADAAPKVEAAGRATTIPPITEAMDLLWLKRDFELATGGTYAEDQRTRLRLGDRIRALVGSEITGMEQTVNEIWESASSLDESFQRRRRGERFAMGRYRGLSPADRTKLESIIQSSGRMVSTLKALSRAVPIDESRDPKMLKRALELRRIARNVLNNNYSDAVPVDPY